ncbi:MAG: nucleotide sugar dehydrogenase [Rickettsiaceae bacterium]
MHKSSVCILGLGYVGLPTACILASSGYFVSGVDIDKKVINNLQSPSYLSLEPDLQDLLNKAIANHYIQFSTKITPSEIYIITAPTPLSDKFEPDISYVENAIDSIIPHIKSGDLVLIESTCPVGTTENMSQKLKSVCPDIYIAYCPERILPGNIIYELKYNNRVIGGINEESTVRAINFYKTFSSGKISSTDDKTAEVIKLAENTYRDINIAYANELSMIADKLNIDIRQLIKLANEHSRVNILEPGVGVGGHCIAVDPHFLISSAPDESSLITTAREVNNIKTDWVIKKIEKIAKEQNITNIACLGLTYKANVSDIRNSPSIKIVESLQEKFNILTNDPYIKNSNPLKEIIDKSEMVVTLVAHNEFINISTKLPKNMVFLDFTGKCK